MSLIDLIHEQISSILTPEMLKTIAEKEFQSYMQNEYILLHSDNIIIEQAIQYIRKRYGEQFKKIRQIIDETITKCNLTQEQEEYFRSMIKFDLRIENGEKICDIIIKEGK